eukprot:10890-Eustigmatos_ZCMA.PRE.1
MGGTESGGASEGDDDGSEMDLDEREAERRQGLGSAADRIRAALFSAVEANPRKKSLKKSQKVVQE